MTLETLGWALRACAAYRHIVEEPLMGRVLALLDRLAAGDGAGAAEHYAGLFYALRAEGARSLGEWLDGRLRDRESPYAALVERGGTDPALEEAARRDIETFAALAGLDCGALLEAVGRALPPGLEPLADALPRWEGSVPFDFPGLTEFYRANGAGLFARHRAFLWEDGELYPVDSPDCPAADEMFGYELQRDQVIANTRAMLEGREVNNVLLYGEGGTGKSSSIKALLNEYAPRGLRMIELYKHQMADFEAVLDAVKWRNYKFVIFMDDLSFEQFEVEYKFLKAFIEGGLEKRPDNVLIYATSNRRHLMKETWSDRDDKSDDMHESETMQEKMSLVDRFGLMIRYFSPEQEQYLDIARRLAAQYGIDAQSEEFEKGAIRWELKHGGFSGRSARQYVEHLAGLAGK